MGFELAAGSSSSGSRLCFEEMTVAQTEEKNSQEELVTVGAGVTHWLYL